MNTEEIDQLQEYNKKTLAPETWDSFIGQEKIKETLIMKINAAIGRYEQLDHCLIIGESGAGKTSLANLIAGEHGLEFKSLMITPGFKIKTLSKNLIEFAEEGGGVVLLDEVHNFSKSEQHYLFSIIEGGYISFDNGNKIFFSNPLTIIGATTEEQLLIKPLLGRWGAPYRLGEYTELEMAQIVERMAYKVGLNPSARDCIVLGRAAAGSPRQAKSLIFTARDLGSMEIESVLRSAEITADGLTVDHIAYLTSLKNLGMSAGMDSISNHSGRSKEIIRDLERLLVKRNYIQISKSGRELMPIGIVALEKIKNGKV